MAEEVQINNVGGEGVASEVTLARLVAVTEQMAKKAGIDPKDVNKKLKALSDATTDTIKVSTKNRDALKKNTKEVNKLSKAFASAASTASGALLSSFMSVARSGTEITRAFIAGEKTMTAFASHLPIVGSRLGILTGLFDDSFSAFQSVAMAGAEFNNSLVELRDAAAGAMMPLDEFTSLIVANSEKLAAFGGTATQGAQQIVKLNKALGSNRNDLLNMGLNFQDINEALIDYQYLTRAGSRTERIQQQSAKQQAEAAAGYTKNLLTLAKLTGQDVKSQQEKIAVAQMDIAMQKKLATLTDDERKKFQLLMADAQAAGPDAVRALQQQFLGMPPLTEGMALYQSQFGEAFNVFGQGLDAVYDKNVETEDFRLQSSERQLAVLQGMDAAAARLGTLLEVAAVGGEGIPAALNEIFINSGLKLDTYLDERGRLDVEAAKTALAQAQVAAGARAAETETMAKFYATIGEAQSAFQTSIVTPLMKAVTPALNALVDAIRGPVDEEGEPIGESGFMTGITIVSDYINNQLAPSILKFIEAFKEDPKQAIKDLFDKGSAALMSSIKDLFLGPINDEMGMSRAGGLLEDIKGMATDLGTALVNGMVDGVKSWWNDPENGFTKAMVAGAAALFIAGGPLARAMIAGTSALFSAASATGTRGSTAPTVGRDPRTGRFTSLQSGAGQGSRVASLGKGALRKLPYLAALLGLVDIGSTLMDDDLSRAEKQQSVVETGGGMAGMAGGAWGGAAAGAALGSVVPILGTAIGGALGGLIGGGLGYWAGSSAAGATNQALTSNDPAAPLLSTAELATVNNPSLRDNIDALKSLDASNVRNYTEAVEGLVEALNKLNEELSQDNDTMFTSRADAGELLSGINTSTSGTSQSTQQLNTTMQQVLMILKEMRDLDVDVERNTRNIIGSNLAYGGVSNVG